MAKKNNPKRKSTAKATPKPEIVEEPEPQMEPATEARSPRVTRESRSRAEAKKLEDEYSHITSDLRRVFILAAVMFALLIALNLVLAQ
jgi:hypothetical protein